MKPEVAVLASSQPVQNEISSILDPSRYSVLILNDFAELEVYMSQPSPSVLILDLDQPAVTNHLLRELKQRYPVTVVAVSAEKFHPNLEESFRHHLFACLQRPIDRDDLFLVLEGACA